jgi:hypothetical protein
MAAKARLVSDGTIHGTHVYVDGKEIDCTSVDFHLDLGGVSVLTLKIPLSEADIVIVGRED